MQFQTPHGLLEFVEDGHLYLLDGKQKPSVTTILSDEGLWFNPNASRKNANIGTALHQGCRIVAQGKWNPATTHPDLVPRLTIFQKFLKEHGFKPLLWEQLVCSMYYDFAGQFDLLGMMGNEYWLVDIKSNVPPQYADLQLALYEQAARECGVILPDMKVKRYTLSLMEARNGFRLPSKPGDADSLAIGLAAVKLWHFRRARNLLRAEINFGENE